MDAKFVEDYTLRAEMSVLGSILIDQDKIKEIIGLLAPEDFMSEENQLIYKHMLELHEKKEIIDLTTLDHKVQLSGINAVSYLVQLHQNTPTAENIKSYAKIVLEYSLGRKWSMYAQSIIKTIEKNQGVILQRDIDFLEKTIQGIHKKTRGEVAQNLKDTLQETLDWIEKNEGVNLSISTGYPSLDKIIDGFYPGSFNVIAARPGIGKTAFALNILYDACFRQNKRALMFSFEMTPIEIVSRMISFIAKIPLQLIKNGQFKKNEKYAMFAKKSYEVIKNLKLEMKGVECNTSQALKSFMRGYKRDNPDLSLVVIDYVQLMIQGTQNRAGELSEITKTLKQLATELDLVIIGLAQLNRNIDGRQIKTPLLSDLKDSGSLEQDADTVTLLHRNKNLDGETTICVAKNRSGQTGELKLLFQGEMTCFIDKHKR